MPAMTRPLVSESVAPTSKSNLFNGNLQGLRSSPCLTNLPPEILREIAGHLDAKSYTNFRVSCRRVRSALDSPGEINERIKRNQTTCMDLHRLSAQGKVTALIDGCNQNVKFSLKHSLHKWLVLFEHRTARLCLGFLFGNYSIDTNTRDHAVIEAVLKQLDRDLNKDGPTSPWLYRFRDSSDDGLNYAIHLLAVDSAGINSRLLGVLACSANRIFQEGTATEKLITLSFLSHFLTALKRHPEMALLLDEHLHLMFSNYPELMHSTRELGNWRAQQNPDCLYMKVIRGDSRAN